MDKRTYIHMRKKTYPVDRYMCVFGVRGLKGISGEEVDGGWRSNSRWVNITS